MNTTSDLTPEESLALAGAEGAGEAAPPGTRAAAAVAQRDFSVPRRLGARELSEIERAAKGGMPEVEVHLRDALGETCRAELASLFEASAESLVASLEAPLVALSFRTRGAPAWLVWDSAAAVAAAERLLGSPAASAEPRALTRGEGRLLAGLLGGFAGALGKALDFPVEEPRLVQDVESLGSWRDAGPGADPHRLGVEIALSGPAGSSSLVAYLPGAEARFRATARDGDAELPAHLERVAVTVRAELGQSLVPLAEILALEVGDVVPLDRRVGEPLRLAVQKRGFARGSLGTKRGRLAARIEHVETDPEENR